MMISGCLKFSNKPIEYAKGGVVSPAPTFSTYPDAQIVSFDEGHLHEIEYDDTAPMQIVRRFVNHRDSFLKELFAETPDLFDKAD